MKRSRIFTLAAIFATSLGFSACASKEGRSTGPLNCTAIGCGASVTLKTPLPGDFATIRTYSVSVCKNGQCLSGSFAQLTDAPVDGAGVGTSFPDPRTIDRDHSPHVEATVWAEAGGGFRLEAAYWPWSTEDAIDGDHFSLTVKGENQQVVATVDGSVTYTTSRPNGAGCEPTCHQATLEGTGKPGDGGTIADAEVPVDASVPDRCVLSADSTLPHVHLVSKAKKCVFSLAEARAGITIPYEVVIDEDVPGFAPLSPYPYGPNVSSLAVTEVLAGGSQSYCLCDQGLPWGACPEEDGGVSHPGSGTVCAPTTLKKGTYAREFAWDGVNWTGPSDTGNPKGAPFPPGDYTLSLATTPGKLAGDAGGSSLVAETKLLVRLVR
ncbi:MAG TPA: hypothetical protein VHE30_18930 [Polyangiaceae bacterium]|nr:hypothetical protein [Polyangiaceae bacterium]